MFTNLIALTSTLFLMPAWSLTPEELMARAMRDGKASAELTGPLADAIKAKTRSKAATQATFEKGGDAGDGCKFFISTVVQSDIPSTKGDIVGDYVTVARTKVCPKTGQHPPEILDCKVGPHSCMPAKASSTPKTP